MLFITVASYVCTPIVLATEKAHSIAQKINDLPSPAEVFGFGITKVERRRRY